MRYLGTFKKKSGLYIKDTDNISDNEWVIHKFNHELISLGYILDQPLFEKLKVQDISTIKTIYLELIKNINFINGNNNTYVPIYKSFPEGVKNLSYEEFFTNAILYYWSDGIWSPESDKILRQIAPKQKSVNKLKKVVLLTENEYHNVFNDLLVSNTSINSFDKEMLKYYVKNHNINFSKIKYKEILAFVGAEFFAQGKKNLLVKNPNDVLRLWAAYSGGDEGLKENTQFIQPSNSEKKVLLAALNNCDQDLLEEEFKGKREMWLRFLFYLNPLSRKIKSKYSNLSSIVLKLRNDKKGLKTFESKINSLVEAKDISVLDLLKKRTGLFMRKIDHMVRIFGEITIDKFLETKPNLSKLVTVYNHFYGRDEAKGRTAILASQESSTMVNYKELEPLDTKLVESIRGKLLSNIKSCEHSELKNKKVFIDKSLYYRPLSSNNRAASLSLTNNISGTVIDVQRGESIRLYVHWKGSSDIDLSGYAISSIKNSIPVKIGWNGSGRFDDSILYSGDNTGSYEYNGEYLDIYPSKLDSDIEWVIADATVYRSSHYKETFKSFPLGDVNSGWMYIKDVGNYTNIWQPENLQNAFTLNSDSKNSFLIAYNNKNHKIVYLDISTQGASNASSEEDALKIRDYLDNILNSLDTNVKDFSKKLNQGHILQLLSKKVVSTPKSADIIFDSNTPLETFSKYLD